MDENNFEAQRPRLLAVAARILGSSSDAEDVVQEAWLRYERTTAVQDLPAWLTTVVTRLCLDQLRRRSARPLDPTAPSPEATEDPEAEVLLAERVGDALQVILETLTPAERVALVLHDVFGYPFEDISSALGRSVTAVRQIASRARRKVQGIPEPADDSTAAAQRRQVVDAFLTAAHGGDLVTLVALLAPDAMMHVDAAGRQLGAEDVYDGADAVAARFNGGRGAIAVSIDGLAGAAWFHRGVVRVAFAFHVESGRVREVELIADPEVLATLDITRTRGH